MYSFTQSTLLLFSLHCITLLYPVKVCLRPKGRGMYPHIIQRKTMANNMIEDCFYYRIVYFINENGKGTKHYIDTPYSGIRRSLENIIRKNLSVTNSIVVAEITALKNGKCIRLLSRSYSFSLDRYFKQINGERGNSNRYGNIIYGRYAVR